MERAGFINHGQSRIFFIDLSECGIDETLAVIGDAAPRIRSQPPKSVLTLTKVDGAMFDERVIAALKEFTRDNTPYVRAAAVVGVAGLQRIILNAVSLFTRRDFATFDDVQKAKDYLAGITV